MNSVVLVGRLARDPELRTTGGGTSVTTFSVAVDRNFKNAEGNYDADFITCVAWRSTAEFVGKWFKKGKPISLTGRLQTRSYEDKQGQRRYVTEVVAENVEFVPGEPRGSEGAQQAGGYSGGGRSSSYGSRSQQGGAPAQRSAPPAPAPDDSVFRDDIGGGHDALQTSDNFESLEDSELPF